MSLEYVAGRREGPQIIALQDDVLAQLDRSCTQPLISLKKEDFAWLLARLRETKGVTYGEGGRQTVPGWSGFNAIATSEDVPQHSTVGYLPVIPASPTELSTVYVMLRKSISVADTLQQEDVVVTLDQAIYAKAQDIVSKHCDEFKRITLRMGGFHVACTFLAVIGLRFGDAGLRDLMVESSLVGPSAVSAVLRGKHYNRALRSHKIIFEAFFRLFWPIF